MATNRERREGQAGRARDWAASRAAKADAAYRRSEEVVEGLPLGEPIHRGRSGRAIQRLHQQSGDAALAAVAHDRMAAVHSGKAETIERQLATSIYSDDANAIDRLEAKLAQLESQREAWKEEFRRQHRARLKEMDEFERDEAVPHAKYELSNLSGSISRMRKRIAELKREQEQGVPDRIITAKWDGECARCGEPFEQGQQIRYNRTDGARCVECPAGENTPDE